MKTRLFAGVLGTATGFFAILLPAQAQEHCVVCTEPAATYRCVVTGSQHVGSGDQLACIRALASEGGHASCSVRQQAAKTRCTGPQREVAAALTPPLAATAPAVERQPGQPPETVEEAVKNLSGSATRQAERTSQQIKQNADATGNFIQRSFSCVASLFQRCSQ